MKIFINVGHGGKDSGAVGNGLREKDIVLDLGRKIVDYLKANYTGFEIKLFRSDDTYYTLDQITDEANKWGADVFVSLHVNAGGGTGFESFAYNGNVSRETLNYQSILHDEIMKLLKPFGVRDRGKKRANLHVLRETKAPAVLTESMFIDHSGDAGLLRRADFINALVRGHVNGIVRLADLKKKKEDSDVFYRVVTGSFKNRDNAEQRMIELKRKGFDSFLDVYRK